MNPIDNYGQIKINNDIYKKDQIKADEVSINSHQFSLDTENSENETANVFSKQYKI